MIGKCYARDIGLHAVGAFAGVFNDDIGGEIDRVVVIADAADESVGSGTAVERVVIGIANQRVCLGIAGAANNSRGTSKDKGFHAVGEGVTVNVGKNRVGACVEEFHHSIRGAINDVVVVSRPAQHRIISGASVQSIRTGLSEERVATYATGERVVSIASSKAVDAIKSREGVCERIASQRVSKGVTSSCGGVGDEDQPLHIVAKSVSGQGANADRVRAFA